MYKYNKSLIILGAIILFLGCGTEDNTLIEKNNTMERQAVQQNTSVDLKSQITSQVASVLSNYSYDNKNNNDIYHHKSSNLLSVKIVKNTIKLFFDKNLINENSSIESITDPIFSTVYYIAEENKIKNPLVEIYIDNKLLDIIVQNKEQLIKNSSDEQSNNKKERIMMQSISSSQKKITINAGHGYTQTSTGWVWQRPLMEGYYREDIGNAEIAMVLASKLSGANMLISSVRELNKNVGNGVSGIEKWKENARQHIKALGYPYNIWNSYTNLSNQDNDIRSRPLFANYNNSDVLISIHTNAAGSSARGTQIYISSVDNGYISESTKLANILKKHLKNEINGKYDANWKVGGPYKKNHGENRLAKMPSVIIELGFHTNSKDLEALSDDNFRKISMEAIKLGLEEYLGTSSNSNNKIAGIFDGAGSLVSPNESCWGCDKDEAKMHPHSGTGSTVVFQWLYDSDTCSQIDLVADNDIEVAIKAKAWDEHLTQKAFKVTLGTDPVTLKRPSDNSWTTLAITSTNPINYITPIYAYCKTPSDSYHSGNSQSIDKELVDVTYNYFWTGTGSIISSASREFNPPYGLTADLAVTFKNYNSLTSFQWLKQGNCQKLKISTNGNSSINSVHIKKWDVENWGNSKCSSLPCTLSPSDDNYYVIKVKSSANAIESGSLYAECIQ